MTAAVHEGEEADVEPSGPRLALVCGLLLSLIGLAIIAPDTPTAQSFAAAVTAVALATAIWAARVRRRFMIIMVAIVAVSAVGSIAGIEFGAPRTSTDAVLTLLIVAVPIAVVAGLRGERTVNMQTVFGAISIYLILGLMFANMIAIIGRETTTPYFAQGTDGTVSERTYFSFVTLATLGYGDLTPATSLGRLLAVFETVIGNLYLVTAVSLVVSRVGAPRRLG